jgi:hypothetical protein
MRLDIEPLDPAYVCTEVLRACQGSPSSRRLSEISEISTTAERSVALRSVNYPLIHLHIFRDCSPSPVLARFLIVQELASVLPQ